MTISTNQNNENNRVGWQSVPIREVIDEALTGFASGQRDESGILQLRMNNISTDGHVILDTYLKVPIPHDINKYLLKSGDILFNNTNSVDLIGKTALFQNECKKCTYSNHITRIRVDEQKIVPEWLIYHLITLRQSGFFSRICTKHVGQAGIRNDQILQIQIPLPPIPEQRRIATILTTVDDAIQRSRQAIAETERLKAGVMHELMTKGIGHMEFREDPDVGRMPKEWDVMVLHQLCELITKGATPTSYGFSFKNYGINFLKAESINSDGNFIRENFAYIDEQTNQKLTRSILKENDILFSIAGALGRVAVVSKDILPANSNQALGIIRLSKKYQQNIKYLMYYFSGPFIQSYIKMITIKSAQPNINLEHLRRFKIILPLQEEQEKIVSILSTLDQKLTLQRRRTAHYEKLKQGLMNELLTGKRRVRQNAQASIAGI